MTTAFVEHISFTASKLLKLVTERGKPKTISVAFNRPANTLAYSTGQAIYPPAPVQPSATPVNGLKFAGVGGEEQKESLILAAKLIDYAGGSPPLEADLLLFSEPLENPPVDGAPFQPTTQDMDSFVEILSFTSSTATSAGSTMIYKIIPNTSVGTSESSVDLYGVLVAKNDYTPSSAGKFSIQISLMPQGAHLLD
ncbi:MAG: hypothetical protein WBB28_01570 [Crinalium sp.]